MVPVSQSERLALKQQSGAGPELVVNNAGLARQGEHPHQVWGQKTELHGRHSTLVTFSWRVAASYLGLVGESEIHGQLSLLNVRSASLVSRVDRDLLPVEAVRGHVVAGVI